MPFGYAVAKRPRDPSCLSVVSFNTIITIEDFIRYRRASPSMARSLHHTQSTCCCVSRRDVEIRLRRTWSTTRDRSRSLAVPTLHRRRGGSCTRSRCRRPLFTIHFFTSCLSLHDEQSWLKYTVNLTPCLEEKPLEMTRDVRRCKGNTTPANQRAHKRLKKRFNLNV